MADATLAPVFRARRLVVVLVALALAALGLAACGSSSKSISSGSSATDVLKQTFGPNRPVKSGFLDVKLGFSAQGLKSLQAPLSFRLTGPFQSQGKNKLPKFDLSLNVSSSGETLNAGAVSTGDKGFLKLQGKTYVIPAQLFTQFQKSYEQSSAKSGSSGAPTFHSLGIDPLRWLTHPANKGERDVAGTTTVDIGAGINVPNLVADIGKLLGKAGSLGLGSTGVPTSLSPQVRQAIERSVKSANVDVYSGKSDKILRRLTLDVKLSVPKDLQSSTAGLRTGQLSVDLTIADLNKSQTVKAPANARPLSELTSALGGLLGGASGRGSSGSSGAPSSGASSKYLQCLQRAGRDIAKVQRCASLVGSGG
jgi:hypothetical protein